MNRVTPVLLGFLLCVGAAHRIPAAAIRPAAAPVTIPFELVMRHVIVKATINNSRPLSFVLDTGANNAIVRLSVAKELGLTLYGSVNSGGAGAGRQAGQRVKGATWSLAGLEGFSQPMTLALPFAMLPRAFGQDIDGIIGGEFIKEFVLGLDYQARTITLHDRRTFRYDGKGETLPLELNSAGHTVVKATVTPIGGQPIEHRFHLDIGSGGTLILHSPFVNEHKLPGPESTTIRAIGMMGAGGESFGRVGRVASLQIGPFAFSNPVTVFSQDTAGAFADSSMAGNIGFGIASRFRMLLDYGGRRIILEPSATFAEPFGRAVGGLALVADGADYRSFLVKDLLENSPASEAGIKVGDVITSVDGVAAANLTLTTINETFENPAPHELTIRRGDQAITVTLTPRKLI